MPHRSREQRERLVCRRPIVFFDDAYRFNAGIPAGQHRRNCHQFGTNNQRPAKRNQIAQVDKRLKGARVEDPDWSIARDKPCRSRRFPNTRGKNNPLCRSGRAPPHIDNLKTRVGFHAYDGRASINIDAMLLGVTSEARGISGSCEDTTELPHTEGRCPQCRGTPPRTGSRSMIATLETPRLRQIRTAARNTGRSSTNDDNVRLDCIIHGSLQPESGFSKRPSGDFCDARAADKNPGSIHAGSGTASQASKVTGRYAAISSADSISPAFCCRARSDRDNFVIAGTLRVGVQQYSEKIGHFSRPHRVGQRNYARTRIARIALDTRAVPRPSAAVRPVDRIPPSVIYPRSIVDLDTIFFLLGRPRKPA